MDKKEESSVKIEKLIQKAEGFEDQVEEAREDVKKPDNDTRNLVILVGIVVVVLAVSLGAFSHFKDITGAAIANAPETESYTYNDYVFTKTDGLWWTEINQFGTIVRIPLHFGPKQVEFVDVTGNTDQNFNQNRSIYIAVDPEISNQHYTLAIYELTLNVHQGIKREPIAACSKESPACESENITVVNCENTQGKAVVELVQAEKAHVEFLGSCVRVSGQEYGLVRAVDRLLYQWYGIME